MEIRFAQDFAQDPKHERQDRLTRIGGVLVDLRDDRPLHQLTPSDRRETETAADAEPLSPAWLKSTMAAINAEAHVWGKTPDSNQPLAGAVATIAVYQPDGQCCIGHVGDTVAWCWSTATQRLQRLTSTHGAGNAVHRYLGQGPDFRLDILPFVPQFGDVLLLASDGLTKNLRDVKIEQVLTKHLAQFGGDDGALQAAARELRALAVRGGVVDDVSVILVETVDG